VRLTELWLLFGDDGQKMEGSFDCLFDIIEEGSHDDMVHFFLFVYSTDIPNHPPADALYKG
jgi:hypothetical protein